VSAAERPDTAALLLGLAAANRHDRRTGLTSVCSANRAVLRAAARHAARREGPLCLESTASQVNQDGGYSGLTPMAFRAEAEEIVAAAGLPPSRLVLGGDHLGPYPWRHLPAAAAMAAARELVRACVLAGYGKLHLDASMRCADDPGPGGEPLDAALVTRRTVDLCRTAEAAHAELGGAAPPPVYVIGTEVPVPGGETAGAGRPGVTPVADVARTLESAHEAFRSGGLTPAWERVMAVVVQPGVEFGDETVYSFDAAAAAGLSEYIARNWPLVYEAHSTDYQRPAALHDLVAGHFAVLKVGPWLTFAFREALFALELIECELLGETGERSRLRETLDRVMREHPEHWLPYYDGNENEMRLRRAFSYSDRCRYYWPRPEVQTALAALLRSLGERPIPLTLLSQYLPAEYEAVAAGAVANAPQALIEHHICRVLDVYAAACGG
jgi:D-tagatose-1,6-bisphosphate aldolase subunit GatZ/KbaZ